MPRTWTSPPSPIGGRFGFWATGAPRVHGSLAGSLSRPEHSQDRLSDRWGQRWPDPELRPSAAGQRLPIVDRLWECDLKCDPCRMSRQTLQLSRLLLQAIAGLPEGHAGSSRIANPVSRIVPAPTVRIPPSPLF
jgi:hypothetical protein